MSTTETQIKPLTLKFADGVESEGIAEANALVRWKVTDELADEVENWDIERPYVLIVVRPVNDWTLEGNQVRQYGEPTARYIKPLTDGECYVSFSSPGLNSVLATVVWCPDSKGWLLDRWDIESALQSSYLFESNGDLISFREYAHKSCKAKVLFEVQDELVADVPKEAIPSEPPQWVQDYVGKFNRRGPRDECQTRAGYIMAPLYFVIGLPVAYVLRTVLLGLGLLFGLPGLQLRGFVHPLRFGILDVIKGAEDSIWWVNKEGETRPWWLWAVNPATVVLLALAIKAFSTLSWSDGLKWSVLAHVAVIVIEAVALLVMAGIALVSGRNRSSDEEQGSLDKHGMLLDEAKRSVHEMAATGSVSHGATRVILLRYQKAKSRVCRRYSA